MQILPSLRVPIRLASVLLILVGAVIVQGCDALSPVDQKLEAVDGVEDHAPAPDFEDLCQTETSAVVAAGKRVP